MELFILLLFPVVSSLPRKYHLILQHKNWSDARAYCQSMQTDLATVKTNRDVAQLQTEAAKYQFNSDAWIGLYNDINSWGWSLENEKLENVTFWNTKNIPPEPNNNGGHQECGLITPNGWHDFPCTTKLPYVCFLENNTGEARYMYHSNNVTWYEAQKHCRLVHSDLTSTRNLTEYTTVSKRVPSPGLAWIGLHRDAWKWLDQTNMIGLWTLGKPDNSQWNNNCCYIQNGKACDDPCSEIRPFFCFSVVRQILKLKVRSDKNVNVQSTNTAILQQIQQKLEEFRLENITVNWRVGRDGLLFKKLNKKYPLQVNESAECAIKCKNPPTC